MKLYPLAAKKPDEPHVFVEGPDRRCARCGKAKWDASGHWRKP